jgi:hypothetical protein
MMICDGISKEFSRIEKVCLDQHRSNIFRVNLNQAIAKRVQPEDPIRAWYASFIYKTRRVPVLVYNEYTKDAHVRADEVSKTK